MKENKTNTEDRRVYKILNYDNTDPYWNEGVNFYPKYRKGFKNSNRRLMSFQIRMYKTWKHNRSQQWFRSSIE